MRRPRCGDVRVVDARAEPAIGDGRAPGMWGGRTWCLATGRRAVLAPPSSRTASVSAMWEGVTEPALGRATRAAEPRDRGRVRGSAAEQWRTGVGNTAAGAVGPAEM